MGRVDSWFRWDLLVNMFGHLPSMFSECLKLHHETWPASSTERSQMWTSKYYPRESYHASFARQSEWSADVKRIDPELSFVQSRSGWDSWNLEEVDTLAGKHIILAYRGKKLYWYKSMYEHDSGLSLLKKREIAMSKENLHIAVHRIRMLSKPWR